MLPKIPYTSQNNIKQNITFYGLNLTDNITEGELCDSKGMSSSRYPYMSQRKGRSLLPSYTTATDIYEWDGHLIVTTDNLLYVDGVAIENVVEGKKQFAVVGNNLFVYPDQLMVNLTDNTFVRLNASVKTTAAQSATAVFDATNKTLTASLNPYYADALLTNSYCEGGGVYSADFWEGFITYSYGSNEAAVKACYHDGAWDQTMLAALEVKVNVWGCQQYGNGHFWSTRGIANGDIIIPSKSGNSFQGVIGTGWSPYSGSATAPNKSSYNTEGYYMVYGTYETSNAEWGYSASRCYWHGYGGHIYKIETSKKFSDAFQVGNLLNITGTQNNNLVKAEIASINDTTNTITFVDDVTIANESLTTSITVQRYSHNFDLICESGNRLWGVENSTNTIWASSLGQPDDFELDDTTDLGAYYVEIGSEGDFTAMCPYSGAVHAWKENRLVKILGDYPSNFYTNEYQIKGVQSGSEKSLCNINEALYYKGTDGVYAYAGSSPSLISEKLGRYTYTNAAGGTDGSHYYISMKNGSKIGFYSYDLLNGLWMKEDDILADSFAVLGDTYFVSDGFVYKMNQDGEIFEWYAEFAPITEKAKTNSGHKAMFERKNYSKLYLGLDMEEGSYIHVYTKEDRDPYKKVFTQSASKESTYVIPIAIGRCDKLQIKLEGKGKVTVEAMAREFSLGSKR